MQPLPLVLDRDAAISAASDLLASGERSLRRLLAALDIAVIPEREWRVFDPDGATLRDVDVPTDLPSAPDHRDRARTTRNASRARAGADDHRRHQRLYQLSDRDRDRPCPERARGPARDRLREARAAVHDGQGRGRRALPLRAWWPGQRQHAARHDRRVLLRLPAPAPRRDHGDDAASATPAC